MCLIKLITGAVVLIVFFNSSVQADPCESYIGKDLVIDTDIDNIAHRLHTVTTAIEIDLNENRRDELHSLWEGIKLNTLDFPVECESGLEQIYRWTKEAEAALNQLKVLEDLASDLETYIIPHLQTVQSKLECHHSQIFESNLDHNADNNNLRLLNDTEEIRYQGKYVLKRIDTHLTSVRDYIKDCTAQYKHASSMSTQQNNKRAYDQLGRGMPSRRKQKSLMYPWEDLAQEIPAYDQLVMGREPRQDEEPLSLTDQWQDHGQEIRRAYDQQGLGWLAKRNEELMTNILEDTDHSKETKRQRDNLLKTDKRGMNGVRQASEMPVFQDTGYSVNDLKGHWKY